MTKPILMVLERLKTFQESINACHLYQQKKFSKKDIKIKNTIVQNQ